MLIELRRKHVVLLCECFQHTMMESESHSFFLAAPIVAFDAVFNFFFFFSVCLLRGL